MTPGEYFSDQPKKLILSKMNNHFTQKFPRRNASNALLFYSEISSAGSPTRLRRMVFVGVDAASWLRNDASIYIRAEKTRVHFMPDASSWTFFLRIIDVRHFPSVSDSVRTYMRSPPPNCLTECVGRLSMRCGSANGHDPIRDTRS